MKTVKKLVSIVFLLSFIFPACRKEISQNNQQDNQPAKLTIYLTDHQTPVFDSVFIDIRKFEVKLEDDSLSNGGWVSLSIRPGVYNILRLKNGLDTLFATGTVPNKNIRKIKMTLGTQNSVMRNSQSFPLKVKDNDREVVVNIDNSNFDIVSQGQVMFWIDFDAGNSIQVDNSVSGNNNGYELKAHLKAFSHHNSGRIEGKVLPAAADAVIKAIAGADTATAIAEHSDGEYKIVGLNAGTYKLIFEGHNGYRDTAINNVVVRLNEDTHLPAITLKQ